MGGHKIGNSYMGGHIFEDKLFFNYHMYKIARNCSKIHCFCPKVNKLCHSQRKFCFFLQHLLIFGFKTTYMGGKKIAISYMGGQIFGPRFTWVVKFRFLSGTYAPFIPLSHPPEVSIQVGRVMLFVGTMSIYVIGSSSYPESSELCWPQSWCICHGFPV